MNLMTLAIPLIFLLVSQSANKNLYIFMIGKKTEKRPKKCQIKILSEFSCQNLNLYVPCYNDINFTSFATLKMPHLNCQLLKKLIDGHS